MKHLENPQIAVLAEPVQLPVLERCTRAATGGLAVSVGSEPGPLLDRWGDGLRLILVDRSLAGAVLTRTHAAPRARIAVVTEEIDQELLVESMRSAAVLGFVARGPDGVRGWEIAYVVRRGLGLGKAPPSSGELMSWGATTVTWRPRTTNDREHAVTSVEVACRRLGVSGRAAALAAEAAHELVTNAMFVAPVDRSGLARYPDRQASVQLDAEHVPALTLAVDDRYVALDVVDPFGRLKHHHLLGGLLRGGSVGSTEPGHGAGIGLARLSRTATVLRAEVLPRHRTQISWMLDRTQLQERHAPCSLYFVRDVRSSSTLYQILQWASQNGSVKAVSRIRMRTLPFALLEGVDLSSAGPRTEVSPNLLDRVRSAASTVVGQACPF